MLKKLVTLQSGHLKELHASDFRIVAKLETVRHMTQTGQHFYMHEFDKVSSQTTLNRSERKTFTLFFHFHWFNVDRTEVNHLAPETIQYTHPSL